MIIAKSTLPGGAFGVCFTGASVGKYEGALDGQMDGISEGKSLGV